MKVSITAMAAGDLEDIRAFIARNNASRAMTFVEELLSRCQNLAEDPRVGRRRSELENQDRFEMRSLAYKRYVILYAVESRRVSIRRVIHGARDIERLKM